MARVAGVVLAGGAGSRMGGAVPKPLTPLLGRPLVDHVVAPLAAVADVVVVVTGPHPAWAAWVPPAGSPVRRVVQREATGNGDALRLALAALAGPAEPAEAAERAAGPGPAGSPDEVVVALADTPLLRPATIAAVLAASRPGSLAILTAARPGDGGYGPVVRDADGTVVAVAEPTTGTGADEVNASVYAAPFALARELVGSLPPGVTGRECKVTDVVAAARRAGHAVAAVRCGDPTEAVGVNTPAELAAAAAAVAERASTGPRPAGRR